MNFNKEMAVAEKAIKKSSRILLGYFRQEKELVKHMKTGRDFATEADFASEKSIIDSICRHFPEHNIFAEERGNLNKESDYLWLIDPLDGTLNFASGLPTWASMLALQYKGEIVLSIVSLPFLKEFCTAQKSKGTYLNGEKMKIRQKESINGWIYFCGIANYNKPRVKKIFENTYNFTTNISMIGSVGAGGVFLSSNRIEAIIADWTNPWDMAAPSLLIKEAGGTITDFSGKDWALDSKNFIASNPKIHSTLINRLTNIENQKILRDE